MIKTNIKTNNGPARKNTRSISAGFTLVETMFAVMILTFTIVGMMTVVANSLFAARYARDEITATYLLQEVVDSIRNDRDTSVFLQNTQTVDDAWTDFVTKYNNCADSNTGCYFDVLNSNSITECSSIDGCPNLYYDADASETQFYVNDDGLGNSGKTKTGFQRKIVATPNGADEVNVSVTISWKNGGLPVSRSLSTTFMKWQ